jgi:hypothetical protein
MSPVTADTIGGFLMGCPVQGNIHLCSISS